MEKNIYEIIARLSGRELLTELNDTRFNEIRTKHPKEWSALNSIYQSEIDRVRQTFLGEFSSLLNRVEELKEEIKELKEINKDLEFQLEKKSSRSFLHVFMLYVGVLFGGILVLLFILNMISSEAYKAVINDAKDIFIILKDTIANTFIGGN